MDGHDHAQVGVHVLELLGDDAEAHVVHARAAVLLGDADPEQVQVGHALQEAALEAVLAVEVVDLRRDLPRRPVAHRLLDVLVTRLPAQTKASVVLGVLHSDSAVLGQRLGAGRGRAGPRPACSFGTRTRTTEKERTLGSGSWLKVWSTTSASMPGLAQAQGDQLGLVDLRGLRHLVPPAVGAAVDSSARRRPSAVLPDRLALAHDRLQALLGVLGGHELVQVDVLGVAERVRAAAGRRRRPGRAA